MRMFNRLVVLSFVFAFMLLAGQVSAQSSNHTVGPRIIACPASQIPAANKNMKFWGPERVANYPVIPELINGDPYQVSRYAIGPTPNDSPEDRAKLEEGHDRIMRVLSYTLFTPPGTDVTKAAKRPPQDFVDAYVAASQPGKLKWRVAPCGETVLDNLSWYQPEVGVIVDNEPIVIGWCEEGIKTDDGKCGVRVVETEPIPITSNLSSYKGGMTNVMIVLRCGNPSLHNFRPPPAPPTVVRPEPTPAPKPAPIVIPTPPTAPTAPPHDLAVKATCNPCTVEVGKISIVEAIAQDSIGCSVNYQWRTQSGSLADARAKSTLWKAPNKEDSFPVTVTATCPTDNKSAEDTVFIKVTRPAAPVHIKQPKPRKEPSEFSFDIGLEQFTGKYNASFEEPIPNSGDVPQRHPFSTTLVTGRFDQAPDHGVFAEAKFPIRATVGLQEFQDAKGVWNSKKRDTDTSGDKHTEVRVGYKQGLGDTITVGGFVGYNATCFCQQYTAQGAVTTTETSYKGLIVGGELRGATKSEDHRVLVSASGKAGIKQTRSNWTQQTFGGKDFPLVTNADEPAKTYGLKIAGDVQIYKMIHGNVAFDYLGYSSTRPNTFTAHESIDVNALTFGLSIHFGK